MLLSAVPLGMVDTAWAAETEVVASGSCGLNVKWVLTSDGTLTISGKTRIDDYGIGGAPWYNLRQYIKKVAIQNGVQAIGDCAFSRCTLMTSVMIPDSVTSIGEYAFSGCSGLTSVTIPKGVTRIENSAFRDCASLTSVTIPRSVTSIGAYVFSGGNIYLNVDPDNSAYCSIDGALYSKDRTVLECAGKITGGRFIIPTQVTCIGDGAFMSCRNLTSVTIPDSVTSICRGAFSGCSNLASVTIPDSVTYLDAAVFVNCTALQSVKIPDGVDFIQPDTFNNCTALTSVTIPDSVTFIGQYAFSGCSGLTSVKIPNGVFGIREHAFHGCTSLTSVTIPSGLASINEWTFSNCVRLAKVTIPKSVTSIGVDAFSNCDSLTDVYYAGTAADWAKISISEGNEDLTSAALRCAPASLSAPSVTGGNDSQGRPTLKWNAVSGAAKYEVYRARSRSGEYIKYSTVTGTSYTNTSYIENGNTYYYKVRALDANGTAGAWSSIVSVTYRKPAAATVASGKCGDSASWKLDAEGTLTISGSGATYDFFNDYNCTAPWYDAELRLQIKKAVVNKGITYVGTYAFRDCAELTSVSLPAGLEEMGSSVFRYCESLTSITIPAGVTSIGGDFFYGCASLKSVTLPDSLWDAGGCTFMDCTSLTSVRLPANLRDIAWWMFKDCTSLTSVTIPRGTVEVKKEAFDGCTSLKNVTFTGSAADWKGVTIRPGNTALTSAAIKCTGSTVLTAPTLTLSVSKKGQPTLKWSAVSGAAGYQLWCSYDGGDDCDPCYRWYANNDKTATSYTVPADTLKKGQTYTFKVRAVTSSGAVGSFSKEVIFTYNPAASLAAPTVTAGLDDQGYPALTWPAVPDAARYEVYRAASEDGNFAQLAAVTSNSYTNSAVLTDGAAYYYKVRALKANGTASAYSSVVTITYGTVPTPAAPAMRSAKADSAGITVSWDTAANAVTYNVYRTADAGSSWTQVASSIKGTSYKDTTVQKGVKYGYKVRGVAADGKTLGPMSSTGVTAKVTAASTTPDYVKLKSAKSDPGNGILLTWESAADAKTYNVYRKVDGASGWTLLASSVSGTSYRDTSGKRGTTYVYTVRGVAADGKTLSRTYNTDGLRATVR